MSQLVLKEEKTWSNLAVFVSLDLKVVFKPDFEDCSYVVMNITMVIREAMSTL